MDKVSEREIAKDTTLVSRITLIELLREHGVELKTEARLEAITDTGVLGADQEWRPIELPAGSVVLTMGARSRSEEAAEFKDLAEEVHIIGDCAKPRNLMTAIHDAFNIAAEM